MSELDFNLDKGLCWGCEARQVRVTRMFAVVGHKANGVGQAGETGKALASQLEGR